MTVYRCPICGNDPCTCNELVGIGALSPGEPGPYTPPGPCIPEPPPDRGTRRG
jgi:hypothetical protein